MRRGVKRSRQCTPDANVNTQLSRTRNKKVNYAALNSGSSSNNTTPSSVVSSTGSAGLSSGHDVRGQQLKALARQLQTADTNQQRIIFPEEREIRRLRTKQKKHALMRKDRDKLKKLREKLRRKLRRLRSEMDKVRRPQQASKEKSVPPPVKVEPVVVEVAATELIEVVSPGPLPEVKEELETPSLITASAVTMEADDDAEIEEPPEEKREMPPIVVLHRDNTARSSQRGRWQEGYLRLQLYRNKDSLCIQCITCRETFTVKKFIKHLHHQNKRDELCEVSLVQKLEPKCPAPMLTWHIWQQFEQRKRTFEAAALKEKQQRLANRQCGGRKRKLSNLVPPCTAPAKMP